MAKFTITDDKMPVPWGRSFDSVVTMLNCRFTTRCPKILVMWNKKSKFARRKGAWRLKFQVSGFRFHVSRSQGSTNYGFQVSSFKFQEIKERKITS